MELWALGRDHSRLGLSACWLATFYLRLIVSQPSKLSARVNILGVTVDSVNLAQTVASIENLITDRSLAYVCLAPAHSIMECWRDSKLRNIFNKGALVTPDGMSVVWILRMQGRKHVGRVYGPDLMQVMFERAGDTGHLHFLVGGTEAALSRLNDRFSSDYPGSRIVGSLAPPFRTLADHEDQAIVEQINKANPDVVWVGLGSPKQERWMAQHRDRLKAPVLIGVGAAFDFLSGMKPQAPRWIQRSGLEWLFRLATEPRRLWPRYRQYPLFVVLVLAQMLGLRRYPLSED